MSNVGACHGPCAPHTHQDEEKEALQSVLSFVWSGQLVPAVLQRARRPPGDLASEETGHRPDQPHGRKAYQRWF